jgi:N-acetylmuramoyl-L-alanine amidase
VLLLLLLLACGAPTPEPAAPIPPPLAPAPPPPPAWPQAGAVHSLVVPTLDGPAAPIVMIDAGHGAPRNPGNTSILCEEEQDEMLRLQDDLVETLETEGAVEVLAGRRGDARPSYASRARRAEAAGASALIQLHSDARGGGTVVDTRPPDVCVSNPLDPGFAVLWSDEGPDDRVAARLALARALARRMTEAGFLPYRGENYEGIYEGDDVPGVFLDRHTPRQRIWVLRRPQIPSVIIETHHARDAEEVARWKEPETLAAFGSAVGAALADLAAGAPPPADAEPRPGALPALPPAPPPP